jgi:hypothetical protein
MIAPPIVPLPMKAIVSPCKVSAILAPPQKCASAYSLIR